MDGSASKTETIRASRKRDFIEFLLRTVGGTAVPRVVRRPAGLVLQLIELDGQQDTSGTQKSPYPRRPNQDFFVRFGPTPTRSCWEVWRRCRKPRGSRRALH